MLSTIEVSQTLCNRMKIDKALRDILGAGNITMYRLAAQAGMDRAAVRKIVIGDQGATWDVIQRIAEGLGKIHPRWQGAFIHNLTLPQDAFEDTPADQISDFVAITKEQCDVFFALIEKHGGIEAIKKEVKQLGNRHTPGEILAAKLQVQMKEEQQKASNLEPIK